MFRNLFVFILLFVSGCIWYGDSRDSPSYNSYDSVWLSRPHLECYYDGYWDLSDWYIEIYADSYYGPYEVAEVGFYINNYDYNFMEYIGDGFWYSSILSNYYDCDRDLHFDFVAVDYDGYEGYYTYEW